MAKAEKYRFQFKTLEGQTCTVRFDFEGFTGSSTTLVGADKPFVLQEFNNDEDLFKPLRPQLATINILASATGVTIDDFLMDNDDDIIVYFDFGSWTNYWVGYLQQDDFQETWIDTNHIVTIRASEGIGLLKDKMITDFGAELTGKYDFIEITEAAMEGTVQSFADYYVYSSLFHDSMQYYAGAYTGLDQCVFDSNTLEQTPTIYDNSYDVLEKVNRAWNQTLFMYDGVWWILRIEDMFIPGDQNLNGYAQTLMGRTSADRRYDALVGVNEGIKPISPEMLRFIQRRTKKDTIQFDFAQFDEIVCNGSFSRGSLISSTSTEKVFNLDDWSWKEGTTGSPTTPSTGSRGRKEIYDATSGRLDNQYAYFTQDSTNNRWLLSCNIPMLQGESFKFSIEHAFKSVLAGTPYLFTVSFQYVGTSKYYTLDENGIWYESNASWSTNYKVLQTKYNGTGEPIGTDWVTTQVESLPVPQTGYLNILLWCPNIPYSASQERYFKNLQLNLATTFNGIDVNTITGIQSIYTKAAELRKEFKDGIYFDDGFSKLYKGSIFESDGDTLTDKNWFRRRYSSERFGFRKQNAIAHWEHNRFNRNKIDANFYGLTWDNGNEPIGLINTIKFVDDDPDKVYWILNLKEIDFSSSTWSATLVEIWDDNKDGASSTTYNFSGIAETGVQSGVTYLQVDLITGTEFSVVNDDTFKYNGTAAVTIDITFPIEGEFTGISQFPHNATLSLKKNGTTISSDSLNVTAVPTAFNFDLSVNGVTMNPGDEFQIQLSNRITDIDIIDSSMTFSYTVAGSLSYDPYEDKYLYK